jgi:hypothetical protein
MRMIGGFALILALPGALLAQAPNPILTAIPPNTALDLGAYTSEALCGVPIQVTDFSRFTYDSQRHQLLLFGGGHASTPRTDVDVFSLSTLAWSSAYPPTPVGELVFSNYDPAMARWISTGHPIARHTYDQLVFAPSTGDLVMLSRGHAGAYCTGGWGWEHGPTAHYDPDTRAWSFSSTANNDFGGSDPYPAAEYDPVSGLIVIVAHTGLWTYDPVTRVRTARADYNLDLGYANNLVYFPPNQKMYYITRESPTQVWEVTLDRANWAASTIVRLNVTGAVPNSQESGWAYDSWNQIIGGGVAGGVFYAFDPLTARWSSAVMQRASGPPVGTQAFHCLDFDPVDGVFLFLTEYDSGGRMWAYRYAGGAPPSLSIDDVAVAEGAAGSTGATFTVRLSRAATQAVTVAYATADGTATAGSDYQAAAGTLTFAPGTLTRSVAVNALGDGVLEGNETFALNLSGPVNATLADGAGQGTILDDEAGRYYTVPPCRLADTRNAAGPSGGPALSANTRRVFPASGLCGIPATARALAVNVTAAAPSEAGNLRLDAAGAPAPPASTLNFAAGRTRANHAIVRLGTGGAIGVQCDMAPGSSGRTHVVLDVYGYFQ